MGEDGRPAPERRSDVPPGRLFVGKLPQDIHEDEIRMIFNTYGRTTDVHLMAVHQQQPGQDRCAFVTYENPEAAKVATQVLHGIYKFREDAPEPINVGVAFRRHEKGGGSKGGSKGGDRGPDRGGDRFGGYDRGPPPGYDRGPPPGYDRGHDRGYDRGCYDRAYDRGGYDRDFDRGGKGRMDVRGKGGYDRGPPPRAYERMPDRGPPPRDYPPSSRDAGPRKGGGAPSKLYIGNLPVDITRDALDMVFSTYGRVMDIHIMHGRAKNGQSCAFVVYSSLAEARTCMAAMQQGYEIRPGEGNIFVKFADEGKGDSKGGNERSRPY